MILFHIEKGKNIKLNSKLILINKIIIFYETNI